MDAFPLKEYGHNLTHVAREGVFAPVGGYEASVARIFQILLRRGKNNHLYNPLLLDLDEGRRWRVVIEVVRRIAAGEAPGSLPIREVIALNYEALFARDAAPHRRRTMVEAQRPSPDDSEWELALADTTSDEMFEQFVKKYFSGGLWPELEEWNAPNEVLSRLQELFLAVRQSEGQILLLHSGSFFPWKHIPMFTKREYSNLILTFHHCLLRNRQIVLVELPWRDRQVLRPEMTMLAIQEFQDVTISGFIGQIFG
jgi:hypothetical protein